MSWISVEMFGCSMLAPYAVDWLQRLARVVVFPYVVTEARYIVVLCADLFCQFRKQTSIIFNQFMSDLLN